MRVRIDFTSEGPIFLSIGYNRSLQGMIYSLLNYEYRDFLHDKGYMIGDRRFKLFTYSRLIGIFKIKGSYIVFNNNISLLVSSPIPQFIEELCNNLIKQYIINLEINKLRVSSITFLKEPSIGHEVFVKTLSPITVYSTLYTRKGKKKTYYYSPYEDEFDDIISENLIKKFELLTNKSMNNRITIEPVRRIREVTIKFKGTLVKGWIGNFHLKGEPELLRVGYECGFGSKNSAGFGMVEVIG